MKCFMGCEPVLGGGNEAFYVAVLPELTIYGHTINAWTRENYPEDWPHVRDTQTRGIHWGCWHSQIEPDGEIGSQDPAICIRMEAVIMRLGLTKLVRQSMVRDEPTLSECEAFTRFGELGWPDLSSYVGLTSNRPLIRIFEPPSGEDIIGSMEQGTLRETWNSLEGERDDTEDDPS